MTESDEGITQVELAERRFGQGRDAEAQEILDRLRGAHPSFAACELAAELLTERRELEPALAWYDLAISRLTEADRAALADAKAYLTLAGHVLSARKGIRTLLGYPRDADDLAAPVPPTEEFDPQAVLAAFGAHRRA